jgi:hypothetical protein
MRIMPDDKDYGAAQDLKDDQAKINADHDKLVAEGVARPSYYGAGHSPLVSNQPANLEQDPADLAAVLASVDGAPVGGYMHNKMLSTVAYADKHGWIARRMQPVPVPPVQIETLELTDAGLARLRELRGDAAANETQAQRDWYRKQPKPVV